MAIRFGLGLEERGDVSPSTRHARAFFLGQLLELKGEAVAALFERARLPFHEFLTSSREEILSLNNELEASTDDTGAAVRLFISNWSGVRRRSRAGALCEVLQKWAGDWNLTDEWCLDHAVAALREQHLGSLSAEEAWREAIGVELTLNSGIGTL